MVEDEPLNRQLLGRLLEHVGFLVAFAENARSPLTVFDEFRPHFIWMDRRMPMMDGVEATSRIRQREGGREVKIAALTAAVMEDIAQGMGSRRHRRLVGNRSANRRSSTLHEKPARESSTSTKNSPSSPTPNQRSTCRRSCARCLRPYARNSPKRSSWKAPKSQRQSKGPRDQPGLADALAILVADFNYNQVLETLESAGSP